MWKSYLTVIPTFRRLVTVCRVYRLQPPAHPPDAVLLSWGAVREKNMNPEVEGSDHER